MAIDCEILIASPFFYADVFVNRAVFLGNRFLGLVF